MIVEIRLRRGTASQWNQANPVLEAGEPGVERDTNKFKIGDGVRTWSNLPYYLTEDDITDYIRAEMNNLPPIGPDQLQQIAVEVSATLDVNDLVTVYESAKA